MLEFPTISDNQNDVVEPAAFTIISWIFPKFLW
jgi:hypothetical protein